MKKKKLQLDDLKVQSFVTSLENDEMNTLKGGDIVTVGACQTNEFHVCLSGGNRACSGNVLCYNNSKLNRACTDSRVALCGR